MALPTMRPQWVKTFKTPVELSKQSIDKQEYYRLRCNKHNTFFRTNELTASKENTWTSKHSLKRRY